MSKKTSTAEQELHLVPAQPYKWKVEDASLALERLRHLLGVTLERMDSETFAMQKDPILSYYGERMNYYSSIFSIVCEELSRIETKLSN